MKILKKYILSALVFTFVFITFHDYLGLDTFTDLSSEVVYLNETSCDKSVEDIVHDSMHSFLMASFVDVSNSFMLTLSKKQYGQELTLVSRSLQVPNPPPLS